MSDLTDFLLEMIAKDEAIAAEMADNAQGMADCGEPHNAEIWTKSGVIDHARVLAECEAKRRVVREVEATLKSAAFVPGGTGRLIVESGVRGILRHLAAVYSDHPDYRDEWRYLP